MKTIIISMFLLLQMCTENKSNKYGVSKDNESRLITINVDTLIQKNKKENINNIQNNIMMRVSYNEKINLPADILKKLPREVKLEFEKPVLYYLSYDGFNSSYIMASKFVGVTVKEEKNVNNSNSFHLTEFAVYKDYTNKNFILKTDLINKVYLINSPFYNEKWILINETKKIGELKCKKAELILNKEKITAYYCEDIPISEGPSKYFGLPGLIVYLEAPDRIYSMTKIENLTEIKVEKFKNGINISESEFSKLASKTQTHTEIIENNEKIITD